MTNRDSQGLILFDFDGTIANSLPLLVAVFKDIATQHQHRHLTEILEITPENHPTLDAAAIHQLRAQGLPALISQFGLSKPQAIMLYLRMQLKLARRWSELEAISGMPEVLHQLAHHYQLGIVTSNRQKVVKRFIQRQQLPQFNPIKSNLYFYGKQTTITKILAKQQLPPSKVVYVGDEVRDIEAANQAGIPSVAVTWGFNSRPLLAACQPTSLVDMPAQLPPAINSILSLDPSPPDPPSHPKYHSSHN